MARLDEKTATIDPKTCKKWLVLLLHSPRTRMCSSLGRGIRWNWWVAAMRFIIAAVASVLNQMVAYLLLPLTASEREVESLWETEDGRRKTEDGSIGMI